MSRNEFANFLKFVNASLPAYVCHVKATLTFRKVFFVLCHYLLISNN